jgi:hypothetical protein
MSLMLSTIRNLIEIATKYFMIDEYRPIRQSYKKLLTKPCIRLICDTRDYTKHQRSMFWNALNDLYSNTEDKSRKSAVGSGGKRAGKLPDNVLLWYACDIESGPEKTLEKPWWEYGFSEKQKLFSYYSNKENCVVTRSARGTIEEETIEGHEKEINPYQIQTRAPDLYKKEKWAIIHMTEGTELSISGLKSLLKNIQNPANNKKILINPLNDVIEYDDRMDSSSRLPFNCSLQGLISKSMAFLILMLFPSWFNLIGAIFVLVYTNKRVIHYSVLFASAMCDNPTRAHGVIKTYRLKRSSIGNSSFKIMTTLDKHKLDEDYEMLIQFTKRAIMYDYELKNVELSASHVLTYKERKAKELIDKKMLKGLPFMTEGCYLFNKGKSAPSSTLSSLSSYRTTRSPPPPSSSSSSSSLSTSPQTMPELVPETNMTTSELSDIRLNLRISKICSYWKGSYTTIVYLFLNFYFVTVMTNLSILQDQNSRRLSTTALFTIIGLYLMTIYYAYQTIGHVNFIEPSHRSSLKRNNIVRLLVAFQLPFTVLPGYVFVRLYKHFVSPQSYFGKSKIMTRFREMVFPLGPYSASKRLFANHQDLPSKKSRKKESCCFKTKRCFFKCCCCCCCCFDSKY